MKEFVRYVNTKSMPNVCYWSAQKQVSWVNSSEKMVDSNEDVVYRKILSRANKADVSNLGCYLSKVKTNF